MNTRTSLNVECRGDRSNPSLLLLHGFMGCMADWHKIIAELCEAFYCIAVDLPGHGKSVNFARNRRWGTGETAEAIIDTLQQRHIQHTHLLGYSMGGRLALYLAIHFPQFFDKVLLESASPGLMTSAEQQARVHQDQLIANRLESSDFRKFLLEWY